MDNSNSLFRDMIQTALDSDLNKTELQVFLVLLFHTLGFGKFSDPLSYGRIAQHTHKRKDHIKPATYKVLATGLFDAAEHKSFDFTYTIGAKFLLNHRGDFFTPTLPKTGEGFRKMVAFSENREHTDNYPYNSLSLHQQQAVEGQIPHHDGCGGCHCKNNLETVADNVPSVTTEQVSQEHSTSADKLAACPNPLKSPPSSTTEEGFSANWENATLPKLPDIIPPQGANKIYHIFKLGTPEQAKNALLVFADIQKRELIQSPVGLLRRLAEWSQDGTLTLPVDESDMPKTTFSSRRQPQQAAAPYSAAHAMYNVDPYADKAPEQINQAKLAGDLAYLHRITALSNESIEEVAKEAGVEYLLPYI